MKGLSQVILASALCLVGFNAFADDTKPTKTSLKSNWMCTTNASTSDVQKDKDADEKMKNASSLEKSMSYASKNCRDCTKITCETKE